MPLKIPGKCHFLQSERHFWSKIYMYAARQPKVALLLDSDLKATYPTIIITISHQRNLASPRRSCAAFSGESKSSHICDFDSLEKFLAETLSRCIYIVDTSDPITFKGKVA